MAKGPTEHDRAPPGRLPSWRERAGSPWFYLILLLIGFMAFRTLFSEVGVNRVSYTEFKRAAAEGKFARVEIGEQWLKGYLPEGASGPPPAGRSVRRQESALPWLANRVPNDEGLLPLLEGKGVTIEAAVSSRMSDVIWAWLVPVAVAVLFWTFMMRRLSGGIGQGPQGVMTFGKTRAKVHVESDTGVGFKDVAGIDEAVEELNEIVEFLKTPEKFRRLGGRIPKGVLLVGPPGTGKTLLARAVAGEAGVPFYSLSGSEFVEMFVGVGAARVRDLFAQAQTRAPAIIFIDELDAIGKSRNGGFAGAHDEREQTLNQLLAEMDGFDPTVGLIILAATNRPEILDTALLRPGRFDRQVLVDRPDKRGRERILEIHARQVKLGPDVSLKGIAARTPGFAGADLANVVNEAALLAARKNRDAVTRADFEEAIERVVAGLEKKNRRMNEREKEIVAYHESGHAVVGWMLPRAQPVHKVSIIPRGLLALGYTLSLPLEDRYLMSLEELRDKIAGLMGGRAAEEYFIGEISTGASNDLKQATEIARLMVREYGMSEELGPVYLSDERPSPFLRSARPAEFGGFSEQTSRRIDDAVSRVLHEGLDRARQVIRVTEGKVEALAARLLATEVVEEEELRTLLGARGAAGEAGDSPGTPAS